MMNGRRLDPIEGEVFAVDKPLKWTSFDVVKRVRAKLVHRLGLKKIKVGHAGTLDPLATGILVICTGRATKRIDELQAHVKEYVATLQFGATTPSYDLETEVDAQYEWEHITREELEHVLRERFTGTIEQVPPSFSACKVDGHRAYKMARKGHEVELKPKQLVIDEIELLDFAMPRATLRIVCSKGTYIRALARDIGEAMHSGAHLVALRRTRVGDARIEDCYTVEQLIELLQNADMVMPQEKAEGAQAATQTENMKQRKNIEL